MLKLTPRWFVLSIKVLPGIHLGNRAYNLIFSNLSNIGFTALRSKSGLQYEDIASGSRFTDSLLVPGMCSMSSSTMSLSNLSSPNDSPLSMQSYYRRRSSAPSLTVSYLPALSLASQQFSYTVGCLPCTQRLRLLSHQLN